MASLQSQILEHVKTNPGATDREITDRLRGPKAPQQAVNQEARLLESSCQLIRIKRHDGRIGNYLPEHPPFRVPGTTDRPAAQVHDALSEDGVKKALERWLHANGWTTKIAWAKAQGIDIDARNGKSRWVIEVKGPGSRQPMRVNYFLAILGETLQRMGDAGAKYSIALPDLAQYRGLWNRLPKLAKKRTTISLLLVSSAGDVQELP